MNTKRPIEPRHVEKYLSQPVAALPYWLQKHQGSNLDKCRKLLETVNETERLLLLNNVRVFMDSYMLAAGNPSPRQEITPANRNMPEEPPAKKTSRPDIPGGKTGKGTDSYWDGLFLSSARRDDYTPFVWGVREQWEEDIKKASELGGCSSCMRAGITRKHIGILQEHIISQEELKGTPEETRQTPPESDTGT